MKLKDGFITYNAGDEHLMVAAGPAQRLFHGMVRSNASGAYVLELLKEETTEDRIAAAMLERYEAPEEQIRADVGRILGKLREIGALDE